MNNDVLKEIQQIKRLLVTLCTKNLEQKDQIRVLNSAGFQPKEIAELIGTTANAVRVGKTRIKKDKIKKERKIDRQETKKSPSS
jgi:DNA-binding transcriptional MerR regulator